METFLSDIPEIGEPRKSKETYKKYLNSFHWKRLRLRKLIDVEFRCEICGADNGLNIHHLTYENIGKEFLSDLMVLCSSCHRAIHCEE